MKVGCDVYDGLRLRIYLEYELVGAIRFNISTQQYLHIYTFMIIGLLR
ncbi:MAG: hypothetical protein ACYTXT_05700 [Nostoc sp.]